MLKFLIKITVPSLVIGSILISGCSVANKLVDTQNEYDRAVTKEILIHMDLETMFPSASLRELAKAAGKGQTSTIDKLIDEGVDVNAKGSQNATALFWSMRNEKGFEYLLAKGADPNVVFADGGTVMHWAARKDKCNMLISALAYGGNPNLKGGMFDGSPAFATITAGRNNGVPACLDVLLKSGADIEFRDKYGKTLLLLATDLARFDIALYLLDQGANKNATDPDGRSVISLLNSYQDAFEEGSATEENWLKLKSRLSTVD